jgi:hypothetical protein
VNEEKDVLSMMMSIRQRDENCQNEIDSYLSEGLLNMKKFIYNYWIDRSKDFPILFEIVRDYYSTLCSSIESERMGFAQRATLDKKMNRLKPDKQEKIIVRRKYLREYSEYLKLFKDKI